MTSSRVNFVYRCCRQALPPHGPQKGEHDDHCAQSAEKKIRDNSKVQEPLKKKPAV
jgi:hypothetical protein